jgi:hypothetical protein
VLILKTRVEVAMYGRWWNMRLSGGVFAAGAAAGYLAAFIVLTYLSEPLRGWRMLSIAESAVMSLFAAAFAGTAATLAYEILRQAFRSLLALKESTNLAVMFGLAIGALVMPTIDALEGNVPLAIPAVITVVIAKQSAALFLLLTFETFLCILAAGQFVILAVRYFGWYRSPKN